MNRLNGLGWLGLPILFYPSNSVAANTISYAKRIGTFFRRLNIFDSLFGKYNDIVSGARRVIGIIFDRSFREMVRIYTMFFSAFMLKIMVWEITVVNKPAYSGGRSFPITNRRVVVFPSFNGKACMTKPNPTTVRFFFNSSVKNIYKSFVHIGGVQ